MKFYREVTEWDVPNHTYYLNEAKTKMVGYVKVGTTELVKFSKPMGFDARGRKFILVDRPAESDSTYFASTFDDAIAKPKDVIKVKGSNGAEYTVTKTGSKYQCSCPGFTFRHTCKHIKDL